MAGLRYLGSLNDLLDPVKSWWKDFSERTSADIQQTVKNVSEEDDYSATGLAVKGFRKIADITPEGAFVPITESLGVHDAAKAALESDNPFVQGALRAIPGGRMMGTILNEMNPVDAALLATGAVGDLPGAAGAAARLGGAALSAADIGHGLNQIEGGQVGEGVTRVLGSAVGGIADQLSPGMGLFTKPDDIVNVEGREMSRAAAEQLARDTQYAQEMSRLNAGPSRNPLEALVSQQDPNAALDQWVAERVGPRANEIAGRVIEEGDAPFSVRARTIQPEDNAKDLTAFYVPKGGKEPSTLALDPKQLARDLSVPHFSDPTLEKEFLQAAKEDPAYTLGLYWRNLAHEVTHEFGMHTTKTVRDAAGEAVPSLYTKVMPQQFLQDQKLDSFIDRMMRSTPTEADFKLAKDSLDDMYELAVTAGNSRLARRVRQASKAFEADPEGFVKRTSGWMNRIKQDEFSTYYGIRDPETVDLATRLEKGQETREFTRPYYSKKGPLPESPESVLSDYPNFTEGDVSLIGQREQDVLAREYEMGNPALTGGPRPKKPVEPAYRQPGEQSWQPPKMRHVRSFTPDELTAVKKSLPTKIRSELAQTRIESSQFHSDQWARAKEASEAIQRGDYQRAAELAHTSKTKTAQKALKPADIDQALAMPKEQFYSSLKHMVLQDPELIKPEAQNELRSIMQALDVLSTPNHAPIEEARAGALLDYLKKLDPKSGKLIKHAMSDRARLLLGSIPSTLRTTLASSDVSFLLRQGLPYTIRHPKKAFQMLGDTLKNQVWKTLTDPAAAEREIFAHEQWLRSKRINNYAENYGLQLSHVQQKADSLKGNVFELATNGVFGHTGEKYFGYGAKSTAKSPVVVAARAIEGSNRAYRVWLDRARVAMFEQAAANPLIQAAKNPDEAKQAIAGMINIATGSGNIRSVATGGVKGLTGQALLTENKIRHTLSMVLFAPSYTASRLQLFNPLTYVRIASNADSRAAFKAVLPETVGLVAAPLAMIGTLQGIKTLAEVNGREFPIQIDYGDPGSADWVKIRVGKTRIDPWAGNQQAARLAWAVAMAAGHGFGLTEGPWTTKSTGEYKPMTGVEAATKFFGGRTAPLWEPTLNFFRGKDASGKDYKANDFLREIASKLQPFVIQDALESSKEGLGQAATAAAAGTVGLGVQSYPAREEISPAKKQIFEELYQEERKRENIREGQREQGVGPRQTVTSPEDRLKRSQRSTSRLEFEQQIIDRLQERNYAAARVIARAAKRRGFEISVRQLQARMEEQ